MTGKDFREAVGGLTTKKDKNGKDVDTVKNMHEFKKVK